MPAHINYETTPIIFYKFVCENPEIKSCYVGHTTNFNRRKTEHKSCCNNNNCTNYKLKVYQIIRENGGWDNWKMVEVNRRICLDKIDAYKKEQQYIEELQTNMNMINAYSNKEEYRKKYVLKNKETLSEQSKKYYLNNKEHRKDYHKNYKLKNAEKLTQKFDCECGGKYTYANKSEHLKTLNHLKYCK
jgi:hypothetical protein